MNPLIKAAIRVLLIAVACFGLSSAITALSPPPDGDYPSQNTATGDAALSLNSTGGDNTAVGGEALEHMAAANFNTAIGRFGLGKKQATMLLSPV